MAKRLALFFSLALFCSGCSNLEPIEESICGNAVVEDGEDCDVHVEETSNRTLQCNSSCKYSCNPEAAVECPVGFGCGVDKLCRQSTGEFVESEGSPYFLPNTSIEVSDMDGDGHPDIVGLRSDKASVWYGSATGEFESNYDFSLSAAGIPTVANLDNAEGADLLIPVSQGLSVALGTQNRELVPVAYSEIPDEVSPGDVLRFFGIQLDPPWTSLLLMVDTLEGSLILFQSLQTFNYSTTAPSCNNFDEQSCKFVDLSGMRVQDLVGFSSADLDTNDQSGPQELALGFRGQMEVPILGAEFTPVNVDGDIAQLTVVADRQRVALPMPLAKGVLFADVDGDGFQDLVVGVRDAGTQSVHVAVARNDGTGTFLPAAIDSRFDALGEVPSAQATNPSRSRWPLAAADLNGDGTTDFVGADGIFFNIGPQFFLTTSRASTEPWTEAVVADFHGDGIPDVVATSIQQDGIDFFVGINQVLFNRARIDTGNAPFSLRVGDFDGDLIADLAFAERSLSGLETQDSLSVIFGASNGSPSPPVPMGSYGSILSMVPLFSLNSLPSSPGVLDLSTTDFTADLLVQANTQADEEGDVTIAFLQGSSERRLQAPFFFRVTEPVPQAVAAEGDVFDQASAPAEVRTEVPPLVVAGRFNDDGVFDVASLQEGRLFLQPGDGGAQFSNSETQSWFLEGWDHGSCSLFTTADLDNDGADELVGVDTAVVKGCPRNNSQRATRLAIGSFANATPSMVLQQLSEEWFSPASLKLRDVNQDGFQDLLILFGGGLRDIEGSIAQNGAAIAIYWNENGRMNLDTPTVFSDPALVIRDMEALNIDADEELELFILAGNTIYSAQVSETAVTDLQRRNTLPLQATQLQSTDFNGDGLTDLLASDGSFVVTLESAAKEN